MKHFFFALAIACLFSCSKEQTIQPIDGTWTIIETNAGTGYGVQVQTYAPSSETTVQFAANGQLIVTGTNPGQAMSPLWEFDRYELLPDQIIRFYQSNGQEEMKAFMTLDGNLFLNYLSARCEFEEKYIRLK